MIPSYKYKNDMIHNYIDTNTKESKEWNSDSVNFHFILKNRKKNDVLYWCIFAGRQERWNNDTCFVILKEYKLNDSIFNITKYKSKDEIESDENILLFENEVISKIKFSLINYK